MVVPVAGVAVAVAAGANVVTGETAEIGVRVGGALVVVTTVGMNPALPAM